MPNTTGPRLRKHGAVDTSALDPAHRYRLLTSLVVPRPIGWLSTRSAAGEDNLAPFSFFNLVSASPPYVVVSIGRRRNGGPKDSLRNVLETGAFCVNVVSVELLDAMNRSSGAYAAGVSEFEMAGVTAVPAARIPVAYVGEAPAVLECRLVRQVELPGSPNTLLLGEVVLVRVAEDLPRVSGGAAVDPAALLPVGRLGGAGYALPGALTELARPDIPE